MISSASIDPRGVTYRQYHASAHVFPQMPFDVASPQLDVDLSTKCIDGMGKVKCLHSFRQFLPNTVNDKYQICYLWPI